MTVQSDIGKRQRYAFTLEEVLDLQARRFFADTHRIALHEGDIVEMAADGDRHIAVTMGLNARIVRALEPDQYFVGVQTTLRFSRMNAPSPDVYILAGQAPPRGDVPLGRVLLVIEVAESSLRDDLTETAARYARAGIDELWVIDVAGRQTFVHREPAGGLYPPPLRIPASEPLRPAHIPGLALILDEILSA